MTQFFLLSGDPGRGHRPLCSSLGVYWVAGGWHYPAGLGLSGGHTAVGTA